MANDWSSYGQERLDQHRAAFAKAKAEAQCNCVRFYEGSEHHKNCPCNTSNVLKRAEELRKAMVTL